MKHHDAELLRNKNTHSIVCITIPNIRFNYSKSMFKLRIDKQTHCITIAMHWDVIIELHQFRYEYISYGLFYCLMCIPLCFQFSRLTIFRAKKFPFYLVSPDLRIFWKTPGKSNYFSSVRTSVNRSNTFDCDVLSNKRETCLILLLSWRLWFAFI